MLKQRSLHGRGDVPRSMRHQLGARSMSGRSRNMRPDGYLGGALKLLGECFIALLLATSLAACNNSLSGFGGFVGNTPNVSTQTQFKVLGTVGTPFTLIISNANQSWTVPGSIPLN